MENQTQQKEPLAKYPYFEVRGTLTVNGETCDFELDPNVVIPEDEQILPFVGEFDLEGTKETYRRLDMFAYENDLTQEKLTELMDSKGDAAGDYIINLDNITYIRTDVFI